MMLRIPERGIKRSVTSHNSNFVLLCDWIEASAVLCEGELSRAAVLDNLITEKIYDDQTFCSQRLEDVWSELRRRHLCLGHGSPVVFTGQTLRVAADWREIPALSFCLYLSIAPFYSTYHEQFGPDYTQQGKLFERLTVEAVSASFSGWFVQATGWSASNAVQLKDVVPVLAASIRQEVGKLETYGTDKAHESGLDLAWFRPFPDRRGGYPVYLLQCASGRGWPKKLHTPELATWRKLIDFTHPPAKAFACPFALLEDEFVRRTNQVEGLLLDRYRLLVPGVPEGEWLSGDLKGSLVEWLEPRIEWSLEEP